MKPSTATAIMKRLAVAGIEASRDDGYSGRGMFGKTTVSISVSRHEIAAAEAAAPALLRCRTDAMGKGKVWY